MERSKIHSSHYGVPAHFAAYAPGRVEVLGNHCDYNGGQVLAAAIDRGVYAFISPGRRSLLRLYSGNLESELEIPLDQVPSYRGHGWGSYLAGIIYRIYERKGTPLQSWDVTVVGDLPLGSGLSSSAALCVSLGLAMALALDLDILPLELSTICQRVERDFAGSNTGLLDQLSSLEGAHNHLLHLDFGTMERHSISIPPDLRFFLVQPQERHSLADSPYNKRRTSCETVARQLGVQALAQLSSDQLTASAGSLAPGDYRAALHVVGENERVGRATEFLAVGDAQAFGHLFFESHQSSKMNFENSTPTLDRVVEAARAAGALGARLTGGGWGGSALVACTRENQTQTVKSMGLALDELHIPVEFMPVVPSDGARVVDLY